MKKSIWVFLAIALVLVGGLLSRTDLAYAEEDLEKEISRLKAPISALEKGYKLEATKKEKWNPHIPDWLDRISLSGVIELETSYIHTYLQGPVGDTHENDIVLATAELDIDVDIAKYVKGRIVLLNTYCCRTRGGIATPAA
ncbi:MAG: hypothetical protein DRP74_07860 [Candidatus Omnitrophota bacterium]|nr:MAG: hypothetical protein DRP74_07860 [Candidatus Omnitrophota bacterium]